MADNLFQEDQVSVAERMAAEALIVDVDGFEGPLDVLLTLSRTQKVDLRKISVLDLARQYLGFVEKAKALLGRQRHTVTNVPSVPWQEVPACFLISMA